MALLIFVKSIVLRLYYSLGTKGCIQLGSWTRVHHNHRVKPIPYWYWTWECKLWNGHTTGDFNFWLSLSPSSSSAQVQTWVKK